MITSTLTSKGQTTIPLEVRQALHLKPKQRLTYDIQGDQVILKPQGPTILDLFGSVSPPKGVSTMIRQKKPMQPKRFWNAPGQVK